ncbi:MAG: peptidogalycan biosysnthesis protein, partial [Gammaproteobacteria bacterium]|nr:peptidogalycan biosysnthesis protein [Gammaproteobacteria bacterium]
MPASTDLTVRQLDRISSVAESQWQRLETRGNPFLSWKFLNNLESHVDLEHHGWTACHTVAFQGPDLVAAIPLYSKTNSHGEFVFDWMIADAYYHAGLAYYPKFVSAIPFTPVIGKRILYSKDLSDQNAATQQLLQTLYDRCNQEQSSCLNFLFCDEYSVQKLIEHGFVPRHTWQYHWHNQDYRDFDQFLGQLTSRRRKQIHRERKSIQEQDLAIHVLEGDEISPEYWSVFYEFYCSTFERKWGEPRFTLD